MADEKDEALDQYVELVDFMASSLLDDEVEVEVKGSAQKDQKRIELLVPESHRGRVIGRGGRIARAMRTILDSAGIDYDKPVTLDIVD